MNNYKKSISINKFFTRYKNDIINLMFYISGLIIGLLIFTNANHQFNDFFNSTFIFKELTFKGYFIKYLIVYSSIYLLTVLFSYSFIGNYILYFVPLLIGIEISIKLSFYYTNYSAKGIGYSILIIIPEACLFMVSIFFTISKGQDLSNAFLQIYKKIGTTQEKNLKSYLISFLVYLFVIVIICLINSGLYCTLSSIVIL